MNIIKVTLRRLGIILMLLIVLWGAKLIHCEILTAQYFDNFGLAYTENTILGDLEYFKVVRCNGKSAQVYYVTENKTSGNVIDYVYEDGKWQQMSWSTVWSDSGSASDVLFPYVWHFIYGGI